jgi:potassium voltage-gated channel subfamily F member 1
MVTMQCTGMQGRSQLKLLKTMYMFLSDPASSRAARLFSIAMVLAVAASIAVYVFGSLPAIQASPSTVVVFEQIDVALNVLFSIELLVRAISCPSVYQFCTHWLNVVDFLAILPRYIELILGVANRAHSELYWKCAFDRVVTESMPPLARSAPDVE